MVFFAQRVISEQTGDEHRSVVPVSTVWGLHACVVVGLAAFAGLALVLGQLLGRKRLLTGLGLAILGYAACGLAPLTNRIFYDEHIYMQIAQTIAHTGRAEYANYARVEYGDFSVIGAWVNKQPNGHPYLLSWMYRVWGASEAVAFTTVRVVTALAVALLYFALALAPWPLPRGAPIAAALCFAFTPLILWWGHTAAVEPTAAATVIAAFFAASLHARLRDPASGESSPYTAALLAATAAFAVYFRPESLMVFPVVAVMLWAADRRFLEDRTTWAAFALSIALATPNLLHLWSVRTEKWGATDGRRFDVAFLAKNLHSNAGYFIQGKWFPVVGTILALIGVGWLAFRNRRFGLGVVLWFAISWGIFVVFYAGGYYYGASSRYAVISAAPVALMMGIGASALFAPLRRQPLAWGGIGAVILMNWVTGLHFVPTLGRESNEARADVDFAREAAPKLPTGTLVISTDPCIWNLLGRNSTQLFSIENVVRTDLRELCRQYPGGIYLHWDYWMNTEPEHANVWRQLVLDTHATVFARHNAEAVKLALFRLDTPYALEKMGGQSKNERAGVDLDSVVAETLAEKPTPVEPPPPPPPPPTEPVATVQGHTAP
jgi:MFS family permease